MSLNIAFPIIALALLAACSAKADHPVELAKKCVHKAVPEGTKVSADKARSALGDCRQEVLAWVNSSMRNACRGECDYSDPKVAREFADRKETIEDLLLTGMSDEIEPRVVRM